MLTVKTLNKIKIL